MYKALIALTALLLMAGARCLPSGFRNAAPGVGVALNDGMDTEPDNDFDDTGLATNTTTTTTGGGSTAVGATPICDPTVNPACATGCNQAVNPTCNAIGTNVGTIGTNQTGTNIIGTPAAGM